MRVSRSSACRLLMPELLEEIVVRRQLFARHVEMGGGELQHFVGRFLQCGHGVVSCHTFGGILTGEPAAAAGE